MSLSLEQVRQVKELAKEGRSKTYVARKMGVNRKTVDKYWTKREEEKEPELSKRIFQMLQEGQAPVKIVEDLGYPDYVQGQVKLFKKLKQQELDDFLVKTDEVKKTLDALQNEIREVEESREEKQAMVSKLAAKKHELEKEIPDKENLLSSLERQTKDAEEEYGRLKFTLEVKKDFTFLHNFLKNPTAVPVRAIATITGLVMDAFHKWASLQKNKEMFRGPEFDEFSTFDIEEVNRALHILCRKFYQKVPQNFREALVEEILRGEISDSLKQLAVKEGYEEAIKTLTHYPCPTCGEDMIMGKEKLREVVEEGRWAHNPCPEQKK